ncbi:MAG: hypothetical protein WC980_03245 [Candidatus Brocadiia bacterium]
MAGHINALTIIATVVATAILLWRYGHGKADIKKTLLVFLLIIAMPVALFFSLVICEHIFLQFFIPMFCVCILLIYINPGKIRKFSSISLIVIGIVAAYQYQALAQSSGYTNNPFLASIEQRRHQMMFENVKRHLASIGVDNKDNKNYPPGWLSQPELKGLVSGKYIDSSIIEIRMGEIKVTSDWHSLFTRLYKKEYISTNLDIWYPGGTLSQVADKIELRERK